MLKKETKVPKQKIAYLFVFTFLDNFFKGSGLTIQWGDERVVRFGAFDLKRDCLKDKWFKFDSMLVFVTLAEM